MEQFADIMTIAEMTPGPIAINSATFVGIRVAGLPGAVVATVGCVLPSCIIVLIWAYIYYRFKGLSAIQGVLYGLRPAVIALIASAGLNLLIMSLYGSRNLPKDIKGINIVSAAIFLAGFIILRKWKLNPIIIMAGAGGISILVHLIK